MDMNWFLHSAWKYWLWHFGVVVDNPAFLGYFTNFVTNSCNKFAWESTRKRHHDGWWCQEEPVVDHSFSNVSRQVRGEGGWIYSIGYWRVDRGILEGGGSSGYWRVEGNFLEAGRRSVKKTGKTRRVKNVELITIWFFCPKKSTKMAWFSKYLISQQNTINTLEMLWC